MTFITTVLMFAAALINFPTHANSVKLKWSFHKQFHCLAFILHLIDLVCAVPFSIILPNAYSALDGDLYIQVLQNNSALSSDSRYLNLFRLNDSEKHFIKRIKLAPDIQRQNITHITVGCHYFLYGGKYQVQIVDETDDINSTQELNSFKNFEVAWPALKMNISSNLTPTYPDEPVQVELTFAAGKCRRRNFAKADRPEYWLEVLYCGQDSTCSTNKTNTHMLYTEQVKHFQSKNLFNLSCDLFGFAGQYAIQLRPISPLKTILAQTFVHADWNDKFVFNVRERSVFPCDPHIGIGVLFEYPSCIENQIRDRIRIFGRLRADIASLKPPTTLEYVTERRIEENKHSMYFECDLFSERFVEYCFTYVTQAIFGAVAEIRVDCVPTLPISDTDSGGWGPWSDWTPCSTTCSGGKRHRYRFCDSPPPRYGAKFCQGSTVETQDCGLNLTDSWECLYGSTNIQVIDASGNNSVSFDGAAVAKCQCGCLSQFSSANEIKVFASSTKSCQDNRLFWLIKANSRQRIQVVMDFVALPCPTQYIRIRDGNSITSELIAEFIGKTKNKTQVISSTGAILLIEFFSDPEAAKSPLCNGRFLARSIQIGLENGTGLQGAGAIHDNVQQMEQLTLAHLISFIFVAFIITLSVILGIHYIIRYRKYQMAESIEYNSPAHTPHMSIRSLPNTEDASPPSRAISTTTLISEVVYLVKLRRKTDVKHSILRESTISEKSQNFSDKNSQEKQHTNSMNSGSSYSTQTIYKVVSPTSNKADSSSVASYPCYDSKSAKIENKGPSDAFMRKQSFPCESKVSCDEKESLSVLDSSKDLTEYNSDISIQMKHNQADCASSAGSNITLTSGCYSAAAGAVNTATIRATNQKECKEKQNLQKLLSRPQSEFSLGNPEDFELDYYDYNVLNAATVPGSYLGMDPAYLVWIPPLEEESAFNENRETPTEDILPRHDFVDPGSNKESPSSLNEIALSPTPSLVATQKRIEIACHITKNLYQGVVGDEEGSPKVAPRRNCNLLNKFAIKLRSGDDEESEEKETTVTKSPSCKDLHSFYDSEDIQFVDD